MALSAPVAAQTADQGSSTAQSQQSADIASGVQDIIVTATRRSANLQNVPAVITALPADSLKAQNITSVLQLPDVVPGLQTAPTGGNNLYLRGVGVTSAGYNEAQVAVYIDGLYLPNPAMSIYSFNNIDQVEVLKGPQGTLYGRNATAGLIAVTTRNPGDAFRMDASIGYDNYDTRTENLYLSAPITSSLAANVAVYDTRQSRGWGKNVFTGNDAQTNRETGVQAKLRWQPAPDTRITANFIYDSNNRTYGLYYQELPGTIGSDGTTYLGRYRFASRIDSRAPFHAYIGSLKVEQDLGFATLMSLTGYQKSDQRPLFPLNNANLGQPRPGQGKTILDLDESSRTWTQELQLTSPKSPSSRFDWVAGFFYFHDDTKIAAGSFTTCVGGVCAPGAAPNVISGFPKTVSYSGYVDATYRFFQATRFTVGLRYTNETKSLTGETAPLFGFPNSSPAGTPTVPFVPSATVPGRQNFENLTYRFVLAQDFTPDVHGYASYNLGFKSGAYNANNFANPPVRPEILRSYEAGLKTELFDRKLRFNLAYFYYDYSDVQVRSSAPPAPPGRSLLQNVGKERIKGVDGDFTIVPARGLSINGGFEFLDGKYIDFTGTTCATPGPSSVVNGVTVGSVISVACNAAGLDVAYAVPFSASLGATYTFETDLGRFALSGNDRYASRYALTSDNSIHAPRAHIVNASLNWTSSDKRFDLQVYVRNLTRKYTYVAGFVSPAGFAVIPGAPRTIGATLGFHM